MTEKEDAENAIHRDIDRIRELDSGLSHNIQAIISRPLTIR